MNVQDCKISSLYRNLLAHISWLSYCQFVHPNSPIICQEKGPFCITAYMPHIMNMYMHFLK